MRAASLFVSLFFYLLLSLPAHGQLVVTESADAQALAQKLVGAGVLVSNVTLRGPTVSAGFFAHVGGTNLGLDSGIVLTNGRARSLSGPASSIISHTFGFPGDADLQAIVGRRTADANVLEFDFVPLGDSIQFNYVFSSDEYPQYVCSEYNDAFGFLLSGPGIVGVRNLAVVPGTNIPVSINSINNGIPGPPPDGDIALCLDQGPGAPFTAYYTSNAGNLQLTHNGHTVVMQAGTRVQPCQTYHLKLVIADGGPRNGPPDDSYDSGVFLEARSLSSPTLSVVSLNPDDNGQPYLVEGCHTGGIRIRRSAASPLPETVSLVVSGSAQPAADFVALPATVQIPANQVFVEVPIEVLVDNLAEGVERLRIGVAAGCGGPAFISDEIEIELRDYDTLAITPNGGGFCKDVPLSLQLTNTYTSYQWTPAAGISNGGTANPVLLPVDGQTYICEAAVGNCRARDSVRFVQKRLTLLSKTDVLCSGARTGEVRLAPNDAWMQPVTYSVDNVAAGSSPVLGGLSAGPHSIRITDAAGCSDSITVTILQRYPDLAFTETVQPAPCQGANGSVTLAGTGGLPPYQFAANGGGFSAGTVFSLVNGPHQLSVIDANGCTATRTVTVGVSVSIRFSALITPAGCSGDGQVQLQVESGGGSPFTYAINGGVYGSSSTLSGPPGPATVSVRDVNGCAKDSSLTIPLLSDLVVDAGPRDTICEGTSVRLAAQTNATTLNWSGGTFSDPAVADPTVSPAADSWFRLSVVRGRCTGVDSVFIKVWPAPRPNAGLDTGICVGLTVRLRGSGGVQYQWRPAAALNDPRSQEPIVQPERDTEYYLDVVDANGCSSLRPDTVFIDVVPAVRAFAGRDTVAAVGQPLQLRALDLGNSGVTSYQWTPAASLDFPDRPDPVALPDRDTRYRVVLRTPQGCTGTAYVNVKVFDRADIYVPDAFTPNRDGRNDVLRGIPVGIRTFRFLRIYNRWGELIFETTTERSGWDGTVRGLQQDTGVYIWVAEGIDHRGQPVSRRGTVTLIR
ncbi:choice-of-anchor L domain-containing protein [Flaviaesturariibacter amylovorans]|uniref:T9SS type B sorting domain-containing protein n=1 Tax=Flaviaesturariibacter amylovorans TaxID=1084520 RepID=A0ABP8GF58_9BACT